MSSVVEDNDIVKNVSQKTISAWDELDINPNLLRGIYACGFENPSPIQCSAILPIIKKQDIIAQAQSGTGKTGAFSIGVLGNIDTTKNETQALILSPTRELTRQIAKVITNIGQMMNNLRVKTIVGGSSINDDIRDMRNNVPHIIVGCTGRVNDMMNRNLIMTRSINIIVLDEADEMLSQGFKDQVYYIFQHLRENVQVALFSATLPNEIHVLTTKIMKSPVNISVLPEQLTLEGIKQYYIAVDSDMQKYATLKDLYGLISMSQCIIYCNSVNRVMNLYYAMKGDNFPVSCLHGNMNEQEREESFSEFKTGSSRVLISSDITARGIDIQQVAVVINFDVPKSKHLYIHRIGRSGRWGRKGTGINLIQRQDVRAMEEIEKFYACQIDELPSSFKL